MPLYDIPVWKLEATLTGPLLRAQLEEITSRLLTESLLDAERNRLLVRADVAPWTGKASVDLAPPDGAIATFVIGARDENHSLDRAKRILRDTFEDVGIRDRDVSFEVTSTWVSGEVDPRLAFTHHIASAHHELTDPVHSLDAVRHHIEAALVHADALGQETKGLRAIIADVEALRSLIWETSQPLIQRLAEAETGTRG